MKGALLHQRQVGTLAAWTRPTRQCQLHHAAGGFSDRAQYFKPRRVAGDGLTELASDLPSIEDVTSEASTSRLDPLLEEDKELHRLLQETRRRLRLTGSDRTSQLFGVTSPGQGPETSWVLAAPQPPDKGSSGSGTGGGEDSGQGGGGVRRAGPGPGGGSSGGGSGAVTRGCPVYVMLPLDTVWVVERDGRKVSVLKKERSLDIALHTLRSAGVTGVMVDVWWGIAERAGPRQYDWVAYKRLFHKAAAAGLKVQAVMSFHAAGGNVGDTCKIPLPAWVGAIGERHPDIFYTDKAMTRNRECLSLGCDEVPLFWGRTPVQMYTDFISAFADEFDYLFGSVISEITVGMGPAGELRYPSYPEGDGRWRFPGVGEYQCYDRFMLADLKRTAEAAGHPEWGHGGPHDAGSYNSRSWETGFFVSQGGSWATEYGAFFLSWYSGLLVEHARRIIAAAASVIHAPGRPRKLRDVRQLGDGAALYDFEPAVALGVKLAGVHWWFKSRAHAAELTAGYYNTRDRDGYAPIMAALAAYGARASFTCVEMRDCEHPPEGRCSPQGLLQQVIECAEAHGVPLGGENALQRYDEAAFERIAESAFGRSARAGRLEQLTFLRMGDLMFDNWDAFAHFLERMKGGADDDDMDVAETSEAAGGTVEPADGISADDGTALSGLLGGVAFRPEGSAYVSPGADAEQPAMGAPMQSQELALQPPMPSSFAEQPLRVDAETGATKGASPGTSSPWAQGWDRAWDSGGAGWG